jgi:hypothetical protein
MFSESQSCEAIKQPLLGNGSVNTNDARRWLSSCHVIAATDMQATEELLEAVFSVQSVSRAYILSRERERESAGRLLRVAVVRSEKLVAEAGNIEEGERSSLEAATKHRSDNRD